MFGSVTFFFEFGEEKTLLGFLRRLPACKGIGEEYTDAFVALFGERSAEKDSWRGLSFM